MSRAPIHRSLTAAIVAIGIISAAFASLPASAAGECRNPSPPKTTYRIAPEYTAEARKNRFEGTILLRAVIGEKGEVEDIEVVRPLPYGLNESAMKALRLWKFEPGRCDGKPAKVLWDVSLKFKLDD